MPIRWHEEAPLDLREAIRFTGEATGFAPRLIEKDYFCTYAEAMAEKLRAALSRQEVAVRDFFDIDHAVRVAGLDVADPELLRLLRAKLAVPGTGAVNVSAERLDDLRQQVDAQLRPVLRPREFDLFDVDRAFGIVRGVAEGLG